MPQPIYLFNTLTKKKEEFKPIIDGEVKMYHCGPTVYDYIHIGNLRSFLLADILRRVFEFNEYKVTQVMNVTDLGHLTSDADAGEDKMTKGLLREGKELSLENMRELANFYTEAFLNDLKSLNVKKPHSLPMASDHIAEDINLISKLQEKGLTYKTSDGIYFETSKFVDYGKLGGVSSVSEEELKSRLHENSEKHDPRDFALWKFSGKFNGDVGFPSPFGKGFPGWHLECSAMSMKILGDTFDIHTGGIDHIPVHHNNEIAQSEAVSGQPLAHYWLHGAFLNVRDSKMAKSAGTFLTLKSLTEEGYSPFDYRYLLMMAHWSTSINFTLESLKSAQQARQGLVKQISRLKTELESDQDKLDANIEYRNRFYKIINDNLDMPNAIVLLHELMKEKSMTPLEKLSTIASFDSVLGLGLVEEGKRISAIKVELIDYSVTLEIEKLIADRDEARKNMDWKLSDELRDKIEKQGFQVLDTPTGTQIKRIGV